MKTIKNKIGRPLMILFLLGTAGFAQAAELPDGKESRKGFFLGLGLGGGLMHYRVGGANNFNRGAFMGGVKIGGGLNENLLLMYESGLQYTKRNGVNLTIYQAFLAGQYFFNNFYVRPGAGFNIATASANAAGVTVSANSQTSLAFQLAGGREFRFGKRFAVSPELVYSFSHLRAPGPNDKAHVLGAEASFVWYF